MPKFHQLHHLVEITAPVLTAIDFLHVTFMHACMLALALVYIGGYGTYAHARVIYRPIFDQILKPTGIDVLR